jgi:hypothetical protein
LIPELANLELNPALSCPEWQFQEWSALSCPEWQFQEWSALSPEWDCWALSAESAYWSYQALFPESQYPVWERPSPESGLPFPELEWLFPAGCFRAEWCRGWFVPELFGLKLIVQTSTLTFVQLSILPLSLSQLNRLCRLSATLPSSLELTWLNNFSQSAPVLKYAWRCRSRTGPQLWLRL